MFNESKALKRLFRKLTIENLWLYIIFLLKRGPMYGYQIKLSLSEVFNIRPATVTVYAVLYKMVREGLIEKSNINGKTMYKVTNRGLENFQRGLRFIEDVLEKLKGP
ncbi:MAG: PadR family transcriptional regulator [Thaumarchaeota archaeon]|nr:MAG: PadR family transcriptional regulator [Nitrososphaerota archaeon]